METKGCSLKPELYCKLLSLCPQTDQQEITRNTEISCLLVARLSQGSENREDSEVS